MEPYTCFFLKIHPICIHIHSFFVLSTKPVVLVFESTIYTISNYFLLSNWFDHRQHRHSISLYIYTLIHQLFDIKFWNVSDKVAIFVFNLITAENTKMLQNYRYDFNDFSIIR
jgi:hypothetical protein